MTKYILLLCSIFIFLTSQLLYKLTLVVGYLVFHIQFWDSLSFASIPTVVLVSIVLYLCVKYFKKEGSSLYKVSFVILGLSIFSSLSILFSVIPQVVELHRYLEEVVEVIVKEEKEVMIERTILGIEEQERVIYVEYEGSTKKSRMYYLESKRWSSDEGLLEKYSKIKIDSEEILNDPYTYYIYRKNTIRKQIKE